MNKTVISDEQPPRGLLANTRTVVAAEYHNPAVAAWEGYPCIEALPPLVPRKETFKLLQAHPPYEEGMRNDPPEVRSQLVMSTLHFFQPLSIHAKLEGMISRAIRDGYIGRNPLDPRQSNSMKERYEYFKTHLITEVCDSNAASGFLLCGMSGLGKSTGLRRVLSLIPQIIFHSEYRGERFTRTQICWVFLECPKDGSTKGLCIDFFKTIDFLMGGETTYAKDYGRESRATNQLMESMANLASTHQIGLIVIDEIQYLNVAKSGGEEEFLNFLVRLVNVIGVPVLLVGTSDAESLFASVFRLARRSSGQGDLFWEPLSFEHDDWSIFADSLWRYQYTNKPSPLTTELSKTLHDVSYGVVDLANRIYLAAQVKAIETKREVITDGMLRSTYRDDFRLLSHIIETLKTGPTEFKAKIRDVRTTPPLPVMAPRPTVP